MSSTPTTPAKATTSAPATDTLSSLVSSWGAFVKAHENIVLILVIAFLVFHFYSSAISAWVHHDDLVSSKADAVVKTDDQQNTAVLNQLKTLTDQVAKQKVLINQQIATRTQQEKTQAIVDQTLPITALASRWATLLVLPPADFTPDAAGNITANSEGARSTVVQLEQVPTLAANNESLNSQIAIDGDLAAKQIAAIASCNTDLAAEKTARQDDAKAAKARGRKSWLSGFKVGFVTGFVGGLLGGHHGI